MEHLCQRDQKWGQNKIGDSNLTIAKFGCTLTSCSMISDYFGGYVPPNEIAAHKDWFTPDGLVLWTKLNFPTMKFEWRQYGRNDAKIMESLKHPDKACILQVGNGFHWVVAVRKIWWKNDYVIVDPWTGKLGTACGYYKNITGSAHFKRR